MRTMSVLLSNLFFTNWKQRRRYVIIFLLLFFAVSCNKPDDPEPYSIKYYSSFNLGTRPFALAVNPESGEVFILCYKHAFYDSCCIEKYSAEGDLLGTIVDFETLSRGNYPGYFLSDLFIGDKGELYVIGQPEIEMAYDGISVLQFNTDGVFQKEIPFLGNGQGSYNRATAYRKGTVYFAGNRQIKTFPLNGKAGKTYLLPDRESDSSPFTLNVSGIAVNSLGEIFLTGQSFNDSVNVFNTLHHLTVYNPDREQIDSTRQLSGEGCVPGAMVSQPRVEIGDEDRLYLSTFYCEKLLIFDKSGKQLSEINLQEFGDKNFIPYDVAVGNKRVYIANATEKKVLIFKEE